MTIIEGQYLRDVLNQPTALRRSLDRLRGDPGSLAAHAFVGARDWNRVVLTGMGASYHVLYPLMHDLLSAGITAIRLELSELIQCGVQMCDEATLVILVSQSGESAEIHRFFALNPHSPVVAVTNSPASTLARKSAAVIATDAGAEFSVSCKTYVTALMALEWVSGALLGQSPEQIGKVVGGMIEPVSDYLADWRLHVSSLQERLAGLRHIFLLGRGRSMAAVGAGGLIVKEAARFPIEGMNSSAFRHGPMEMLTPHMLALVMEGDPQCAPLNDSLLATIKSQGNFAELIGPSAPLSALRLPPCPLRHRPTLEILPVQMITFALAALSGREAGVFAHLTKVTTVE